MNQYPHHIGDFNNATRYLSRIERSIYSDMIDMYYDTEAPLSLDSVALKRKLIARTQEEIDAVDFVLVEFFIKTESGWFNERCDVEITKYHSNQTAKAQAGKASAAKREQDKQNKLAKLNSCSTAVQQPIDSTQQTLDSVATEGEQNPTNRQRNPTNQEPITNNQEPLKAYCDFDIPFETFWSLYDKKVSLYKAAPMWMKLSNEDRKLIIDYLPRYVKSKPDKQWRKDPHKFLEDRGWLDEIIESVETVQAESWDFNKFQEREIITVTQDEFTQGVIEHVN
jgi:uncharacterized protein YdaU (DUF1376 family)